MGRAARLLELLRSEDFQFTYSLAESLVES